MMTAQEYRLLGARLRGDVADDDVQRTIRISDGRRYVGDSMKFAGGAGTLSQNQDRGLSPIIWDNFNLTEMRHNPSKGSFFFDDFLHLVQTTASNVVKAQTGASGYIGYITSSATLQMSNSFLPGDKTKANGVVTAVTTAAANSTVSVEAGDGNGGSWGITGNQYPKLAYECRVYFDAATVGNTYSVFLGLAEKGLGVVIGSGSLISATDTVNQKSFIGFYALAAAGANIIPAYGKNAVAAVPVTNGYNSGVGTMPARTWTKLGFVYDPNPHGAENPAGLLKFYQDGRLLGWVTDCSVTAFPTTKLLTPLIQVKSDAAGTGAITFATDWHAVAVQVDG